MVPSVAQTYLGSPNHWRMAGKPTEQVVSLAILTSHCGLSCNHKAIVTSAQKMEEDNHVCKLLRTTTALESKIIFADKEWCFQV